MSSDLAGVFEKFDPMEGEVPSYHSEAFDYILFMARKYLQGKTSPEVIAIHKKSVEVISETRPKMSALDRLAKRLEAEEKGLENTIEPHTDSQDLLESWNAYRKEKRVLEGFKWSELFAAQALAFVSLSVFDEKEKNPNDEELGDWNLYNVSYLVAMWGFDAMQSIGYATMCYAIENKEVDYNVIDELFSQKISDRNKKAGKARHSKTNAIKAEFLHYYNNNGPFPSKAEAARKFFKKLPPEKKSLFAPTNGERTLRESLP